MNKSKALCGYQLSCANRRLIKRVAEEYDSRTASTHRINLNIGGGHWHNNSRFDTEFLCSQRDALGVITGRRCHYTRLARRLIEPTHFVVSAAAFERKDGLQIFSFQPDLII
jgi:hypothetical protein